MDSFVRTSLGHHCRMDSCVRTSLPSRQGQRCRSHLFFERSLLWDFWLKPTTSAPLPLPHDVSGCLLFTFPLALRLGATVTFFPTSLLHSLVPIPHVQPQWVDEWSVHFIVTPPALMLLPTSHCHGVSIPALTTRLSLALAPS
jgi:hypothetical protein